MEINNFNLGYPFPDEKTQKKVEFLIGRPVTDLRHMIVNELNACLSLSMLVNNGGSYSIDSKRLKDDFVDYCKDTYMNEESEKIKIGCVHVDVQDILFKAASRRDVFVLFNLYFLEYQEEMVGCFFDSEDPLYAYGIIIDFFKPLESLFGNDELKYFAEKVLNVEKDLVLEVLDDIEMDEEWFE